MADVMAGFCRVCKSKLGTIDIELGQIFCSVNCQLKRDPIDDSYSLLRREDEEDWFSDQLRNAYDAY
jgi:hypothetical protein